MKNHLEQILESDNISFKEEEITFMIDNIGSIDWELRDAIIYSLFYRGFSEGFFTLEQVQKISQSVISKELLFQGITEPKSDDVFTRSFTALLCSLIIYYDHQPTYSGFLANQDRAWFFENAQIYLLQEKDYRGYVTDKGWAHSLAHGADFLASSLTHPDFPSIQVENVLKVLQTVLLTSRTSPLIDDEENRFVPIIINLLENDKLPIDILAIWIEKLLADLPPYQGILVNFYTRLSVKLFLFNLYFKLKAKNLLTTSIATTISAYCDR